MSGKDQHYLDSRIFGSSTSSDLSKNDQSRKLLANRTEDETFVKEANVNIDKPSGSIYDWTKSFGISKEVKSKDIGTWITVIGVIPGHLEEVIQFFSKYGTILRVDDTSGNWVYLEYPSADIAEMAFNSCSKSPQLINNRMAVSCVLGRIRSEYVTERPKPPDSVDFVPRSAGVIIPDEKKGIVGSIFDSVFG